MPVKTTVKRKSKAGRTTRKQSTRESKGSKAGNAEANQSIKVGGHSVKLTNQNKFYWPEEQITKGRLIAYYNTISKYIIPHLKDRPQSLKRNPNGITEKGFYHKDAGDDAPEWV